MPVVVEPYNEEWPHQFTQIKADLETILGCVEYVSIEHVGSTSVPGLAAKPILDIDIVVLREQLQTVLSALSKPETNLLYLGELGISDRHAFRSPYQLPARNLYVCVQDSPSLRNHLAVRELLRKDDGLREEYGKLKSDLAQRGLEIHEYMDLKNDLVLRILELSGCMSDKELEDIRKENRTGPRVKPIRTHNLLLREFVVGDSEALQQLGLSRTIEEAQELAVEINKNADQNPRKHIELAVLLSDSQQKGKSRLVGRVGARVADTGIETTDRELMLAFDAILNSRQPVPNAMWLYVFLDPELDEQGYASEAMDAFIPVLAKDFGYRPIPGVAELKDSGPSDGKTGTSSDLAGKWGLRRIDKRVIKGSIVFYVEFDT